MKILKIDHENKKVIVDSLSPEIRSGMKLAIAEGDDGTRYEITETPKKLIHSIPNGKREFQNAIAAIAAGHMPITTGAIMPPDLDDVGESVAENKERAMETVKAAIENKREKFARAMINGGETLAIEKVTAESHRKRLARAARVAARLDKGSAKHKFKHQSLLVTGLNADGSLQTKVLKSYESAQPLRPQPTFKSLKKRNKR